MLAFALRNLVRNRARSALALLGLAACTAGVVLLLSLSFGARRMVSDAMDMSRGIMVMRKHAPDPLLSKIPADLEDAIASVPGVSAVVPEVWQLAFSIEGSAALRRGVTNVTALLGARPDKRARMRQGGIFGRTLVEGRLFRQDELDGALVSRRIAREFKKSLGQTIRVLDHEFLVTGIFDTGTPVYDNVFVAHEARVRAIAEVPSSAVSCFYCEVAPGQDPEVVAARIAGVLPPSVEARSTQDWGREVNSLVSDLDPYLVAISFVAGAIGALGVVNTMLMSVRERVRELGVLRATGWTRSDAFRLVLAEACVLGAVGGAAGALAGLAAARLAGVALPIQPHAPAGLVLASFGFSVALGALGGLYPAVYAARLDPIAAIRGGGA